MPVSLIFIVVVLAVLLVVWMGLNRPNARISVSLTKWVRVEVETGPEPPGSGVGG
ncbi:MAG: hypothetical protein WCD35_12095 [Mycobacteriales bacterium]